MTLLPFLHRVCAKQHLSEEDAQTAMESILDGAASTPQVAAFLVALRMKGETVEELTGFARAMRARVDPVVCSAGPEPLIDTCGTGGDGLSTFNISTVAAFVIAGAGVRVAKHGNRSISSRCGSADVLEELGVNLAIPAARSAQAICETGIGFLFAPHLHPAMRHAQPARLELKMRTAFNLLGPLTNPAGARAQLIGAPSEDTAELMARSLAALGTGHSYVVHGLDGLDEISTSGPTLVFEITGHSLRKHLWTPADFGVRRAKIEDLAGGDRDTNAAIARAILAGDKGAHRDIVLANAAVALSAAGRATDLHTGMSVAAESIDSGAAAARLRHLVAFTSQ